MKAAILNSLSSGLILFLLCFSSYFLSLPDATASIDPKDKAKVLLAEIKPVQDTKKILVPARVEAKIQSLITADIEGHVIQILRPLGTTVKAGETILYLENRDPGFTYAKVPVKAPIQGVLGQLHVSQMSKVVRGDKLFTVINPHSLKVETEFAGVDASLIKPQMEGVFKTSQQIFPVKVVGISPLLDSRTGTAPAQLEFVSKDSDKKASSLPPIGSLGQVSFEIQLGKVVLIPENSLFYQDGRPLVRILKEGQQVKKKAIVLGEQREDFFVVKSGLAAGEKIVLRSSRPLKEGERVEVEKGPSSQSAAKEQEKKENTSKTDKADKAEK